MRTFRLAGGFDRLDALEGKLCIPCNSFARFPGVSLYFRVASRLGDGIAWYAMLGALPLAFGQAALLPVAHMALTGLLGVGLYKMLKNHLVRERPFASHAGVQAVARPLDRYSFPSGHTMHAVSFLVMLNAYYPAVMWVMLPFGVSVAASRVILGLHYPTDVLAGALIGWMLAETSLRLVVTVLI
jgi:undecaprenyl-diphosphatase